MVLIIWAIGQLFCGMSLPDQRVAHVLRVLARRRDPGLADLEPRQPARIPFNAVLAVASFALVLTLPALKGNKRRRPGRLHRGRLDRRIGLYIAYVIPICLRWRMGGAFEAGPVDARGASTSG